MCVQGRYSFLCISIAGFMTADVFNPLHVHFVTLELLYLLVALYLRSEFQDWKCFFSVT